MNHRVEFLQRFHWLLLMYIKRRLRGGSRWDGIGKKEKRQRIDDKNWSFETLSIAHVSLVECPFGIFGAQITAGGTVREREIVESSPTSPPS
jgi:hypothetical protein